MDFVGVNEWFPPDSITHIDLVWSCILGFVLLFHFYACCNLELWMESMYYVLTVHIPSTHDSRNRYFLLKIIIISYRLCGLRELQFMISKVY